MNRIWIVLMICLLPFTGYAQYNAGKTVKDKHKKTKRRAVMLPRQAVAGIDSSAFVCFTDYYSYYDPMRGGYVYRDKGKWDFSISVPPYIENAVFPKEQVQIFKGLGLDLYPELNYPYYMELYPPVPGNNLVPVPVPGNPAH